MDHYEKRIIIKESCLQNASGAVPVSMNVQKLLFQQHLVWMQALRSG